MTRFMKLVIFSTASSLMVISHSTYAGRPLSTDDVGTVERGHLEFEGDFDDNPCSGLAGLNYALNEMVLFDFGVGFKISDTSPDYRIITGSTLGF